MSSTGAKLLEIHSRKIALSAVPQRVQIMARSSPASRQPKREVAHPTTSIYIWGLSTGATGMDVIWCNANTRLYGGEE